MLSGGAVKDAMSSRIDIVCMSRTRAGQDGSKKSNSSETVCAEVLVQISNVTMCMTMLSYTYAHGLHVTN